MDRAMFPSCYLSWGQTMVEVIKIMATSFQRSHAHTVALSAPNPAAGYHQSTPLQETPGHSQASLGQALAGSLLLSPGSWCVQGFICVLHESVSPVLCKFWCLYGGVNGNLVQEGLRHTQVCCTQTLAPAAVHCWPVPCRRHSNTFLAQSLWGLWVLVCPRFVWALWASLVGMGFDSKRDYAPPTILLGLLLCPWMRDIS